MFMESTKQKEFFIIKDSNGDVLLDRENAFINMYPTEESAQKALAYKVGYFIKELMYYNQEVNGKNLNDLSDLEIKRLKVRFISSYSVVKVVV